MFFISVTLFGTVSALVDTYGSFGFGFLHTSKHPEAAVALLYNDVFPTYRE